MVMRRVEAVGKDSSVFLRGVPVDILWDLRWRGIVEGMCRVENRDKIKRAKGKIVQ